MTLPEDPTGMDHLQDMMADAYGGDDFEESTRRAMVFNEWEAEQ